MDLQLLLYTFSCILPVLMLTLMKPLFNHEYYLVWVDVVLQNPVAKHRTINFVVFGKFLATGQFIWFHIHHISLVVIFPKCCISAFPVRLHMILLYILLDQLILNRFGHVFFLEIFNISSEKTRMVPIFSFPFIPYLITIKRYKDRWAEVVSSTLWRSLCIASG